MKFPGKDLTNQHFGYLTVLERIGVRNKNVYWRCQCECGNEVIRSTSNLLASKFPSCGCMKNQVISKSNTTHGLRDTRLYRIYSGMMTGCYNPRNRAFKWYGERGIAICTEWRNSFKAFYDWAISNGYREDLSIDRIDPDGDYTPSNCRWVTMTIQNQNKSGRKRCEKL